MMLTTIQKTKPLSIGKPSSKVPTWQELFLSEAWLEQTTQPIPTMPLMLGRTEEDGGKEVVVDLAQAPHLLVAGIDGDDNLAVVSQLLHSLLLTHTPEQLRLLLFEANCKAFVDYKKVPHLLAPVLHEPSQLAATLSWLEEEMMQRYALLSKAKIKSKCEYSAQGKLPIMPYIVMVMNGLFIDTLERKIAKKIKCSLSALLAKSRAVGIHFILATQHADIKALPGMTLFNLPWRIVLKMQDRYASRRLLDCAGAEQLRGKGDMLFKEDGRLQRIQAGHASCKVIQQGLASLNSVPQVFNASLWEAISNA